MKSFKHILPIALLIGVIPFGVKAQSQDEQVLALLTEADWCGICKKHNGRTQANFNENNQDGFFKLIHHDLSDDDTDAKTMLESEAFGIGHLTEKYSTTGVIVFIDKSNKNVIMTMSIKKPDEKLDILMNSLRELYLDELN